MSTFGFFAVSSLAVCVFTFPRLHAVSTADKHTANMMVIHFFISLTP